MTYTDDFYTKKASDMGTRVRDYFKLEEIDKKVRIKKVFDYSKVSKPIFGLKKN